MMARQLTGAVQSLANWWDDHRGVPASVCSRWRWISPGWGSSGSGTVAALRACGAL